LLGSHLCHGVIFLIILVLAGLGEAADAMVLDIDKWLCEFSFTVKLVSEIMSAFCAHTIDGLANGGKLPLAAIPAFSNDC
jgi:hypothetical protein